jgi:hypothetical protein
MDPERHGRSLCQRQGASCGACCGLYNRADLSRAAVREDLRRSTALLARTPRTPEAFRAAAAERARQLPAPVFPSIRICPLLGFLDAAEERVGCLAHPKVTGGVDLRSCGVYDVLTCDAFLCPSHAHLREEEALLVAAAAGDFHLYGLVVTDAPFVHAILGALAERTGLRAAASDLRHGPFQEALRALFSLKEDLEAGSEGIFGAFRVREAALGAAGEGAPEDRILDALGADVASGNDEDALRAEIGRRLGRCAAALAEAARAPRAPGRAARP